ncbi:MAG: AAA family ATPase [Ignavibacteriaceae bacterium]
MSHLIKANIEGLAGRNDNISIDFDRNINIIHGCNGSGKTSLLKILHSAMNGNTSIIENVYFDKAEVMIYSINYDKIFTREIKKQNINKGMHPEEIIKEIQFTPEMRDNYIRNNTSGGLLWSETPKLKSEMGLTRWAHRYLPTTRLHTVDDPIYSTSKGPSGYLTEDFLDDVFAKTLERLWINYNNDLLAAVKNAQEKGLSRILETVLSSSSKKNANTKEVDLEKAYEKMTIFLKRQSSPKLLGSLNEFSKRYKSDLSLQKVVNDIFDIEKEIDKIMDSRRHLENIISRLYSNNKKIRFEEKSLSIIDKKGNKISLSSLSSGEKHLIKLLLESIMGEENSVLIDEPEISLHIDWQYDLVNTFNTLNNKAQYIIATHSPEIMAKVPDNKVIVL